MIPAEVDAEMIAALRRAIPTQAEARVLRLCRCFIDALMEEPSAMGLNRTQVTEVVALMLIEAEAKRHE